MRINKSYSVWCVVFIAVLIFSACQYSKEYKQVKVDDKFTLMVPPWVKEEPNLKPGAQFQYANRFRNFYAIGEAVAKDSTKSLSSIMGSNLAVISKAMDKQKAQVTDSVDVIIGGVKGVRVEIYGKMNGEAIYFSELVLEGKNSFYHLSVWTRTADRKLKFKDDIDRILNSFKEQ